MVKQISVTIPDWVYNAIEERKKAKKQSRSETISELVVKGLLVTGSK